MLLKDLIKCLGYSCNIKLELIAKNVKGEMIRTELGTFEVSQDKDVAKVLKSYGDYHINVILPDSTFTLYVSIFDIAVMGFE